MKKVLITDSVHEYLINGLSGLNYICDLKEGIGVDTVLSIIEDYTGIIINSRIIIDKAFINKAKNLKFLGRTGSGMEIVDLEYAAQKGIRCISSPEGNCNAVAEHALGLLLAMFNNIIKGNLEVKSEIWQREQNRGAELEGKTIGIVGYGHTGSAFAKKLRGFDVEVMAFDKYKKGFNNTFVKEASFKDILNHADVLSLHLPLTKETLCMFNKEVIESFKKPFYLINTSRGKVVNTFDLIDGLESKKVIGAALDVLENEKFENFSESDQAWFLKLKSNPNVTLTPHIAGWSRESKLKMAQVLLEKISAIH